VIVFDTLITCVRCCVQKSNNETKMPSKQSTDNTSCMSVLSSMAHDLQFSDEKATATDLARVFLSVQCSHSVLSKISETCLTESEIASLRKNPFAFARYHKSARPLLKSGEEETETHRLTQKKIENKLRSRAAFTFPASVWRSLFRSMEVDPKISPAKTELISLKREVPNLALFARDVNFKFKENVSQSAYIPLFYMLQMSEKERAGIVDGWDERDITNEVREPLKKFLTEWRSPVYTDVGENVEPGNTVGYAKEISRILTSFEVPETIKESYMRTERERRARVAEKSIVPDGVGGQEFELRKHHERYVAANPISKHEISAIDKLMKTLSVKSATPKSHKEMLFLFSQVANHKENLEMFWDAEDPDMARSLNKCVESREVYVTPVQWKEFVESRFGAQMVAGESNVDILRQRRNKSTGQRGVKNLPHMDAFIGEIAPYLRQHTLDHMNDANRLARLLTAYANEEWEEKWTALFGQPNDDLSYAIEQFRSRHPDIGDEEMSVVVDSIFT
jgi:hypothetical protein